MRAPYLELNRGFNVEPPASFLKNILQYRKVFVYCMYNMKETIVNDPTMADFNN